MNTATVEKNVTRNEITRHITETYTIDNYRVKVSTWHDKNRKAYITSVSECQIDKRDGYTIEFHGVFTDYYKTIKTERVSRYSFNTLEKFHDSTAQECAVIVNQLLEKENIDDVETVSWSSSNPTGEKEGK